QPLLAAQAAVLRGQHLVFPRLELRRDVALGVLQCLATSILGWHLVDLPARDFDKEPVHAVEFNAQSGYARAFTFASLKLQQTLAAVTGQPAQLVQLFVEAGGNHAAIADHQSRFRVYGTLQQLGDGRVYIYTLYKLFDGLAASESTAQMPGHIGQYRQCLAQTGQLALPNV